MGKQPTHASVPIHRGKRRFGLDFPGNTNCFTVRQLGGRPYGIVRLIVEGGNHSRRSYQGQFSGALFMVQL